ncbi:beta-galactosidase [Pedobacter sp. SD-b]|uniref:Beta-galactosidase n=1 Tax=Pedobacter segetis TaxID=2793069 RepID=A0ABS1BL39_9SPHI|nr:sugar-binding domain-containing protein [Pedobacter segetis]MBK0383609.1 beta-galactosidase [Pedobacter segetis]
MIININSFQNKRTISLIFFITVYALLASAQEKQPVIERIKTKWAQTVTADNVWRTYPRPQLKRENWLNLNGEWEYKVTNINAVKPTTNYDGQILVPFCIESSLSGVTKAFKPTDKLWYKRTFIIDKSWKGQNIILNFGAVDYEATVWINKKLVGKHIGGYDAFSFDITKYLNNSGEQLIEVAVVDPTDSQSIIRGKQQLEPSRIRYTAVSGIWQTVWLEPVEKTSINSFLPETNIDNGVVKINTSINGSSGDEQLLVKVLKDGKEIFKQKFEYKNTVEIKLDKFDLWWPELPNLYKIEVTLSRDKKVLDHVRSYFAMRKVEARFDEKGYRRVFLNNKPLFQFGTLDQGWWPDGLYTAPSAEALKWDIEQLKEIGFNTFRKHIKVEPALYYYYTDSIGMMVWQDMPSGMSRPKQDTEMVKFGQKNDWDADSAYHKQWKNEFDAMVNNLRFFPSITTWVIFNEGWGQFDTENLVKRAAEMDKTRIIDGVSGWEDRKVGDMIDIHNYPSSTMQLPQFYENRIAAIGEFGGLGLAVKGHLWDANKKNWGYRDIDDQASFSREFLKLVNDLKTLIPQGLGAAIYTQTTDVEGEVNGLITYDRKVIKVNKAESHDKISELYNISPEPLKILISDARREQNYKLVKLNNNPLEKKQMPFAVKSKAKITSQEKFSLDAIPKNLSFWLKGSGGDVTIKINGKEMTPFVSRNSYYYNQFNISNASSFLKLGENIFEVTVDLSVEKASFDYGLVGF